MGADARYTGIRPAFKQKREQDERLYMDQSSVNWYYRIVKIALIHGPGKRQYMYYTPTDACIRPDFKQR